MLLENVDLIWILIPLFLGGIFYSKIARHKIGHPLRDALQNLQIMLLMASVIFMVMWLLLPSTPSLSTFGYPDTVEDINSQEKILRLLQDYNKAIVRTTQVVNGLLFILVFWILLAVIQLLTAYKNRIDIQLAKENDEQDSKRTA